jgi:hypothetical protein
LVAAISRSRSISSPHETPPYTRSLELLLRWPRIGILLSYGTRSPSRRCRGQGEGLHGQCPARLEHQDYTNPREHQRTETISRLREYAYLQEYLNNGEQPRHSGSDFARRRSEVFELSRSRVKQLTIDQKCALAAAKAFDNFAHI